MKTRCVRPLSWVLVLAVPLLSCGAAHQPQHTSSLAEDGKVSTLLGLAHDAVMHREWWTAEVLLDSVLEAEPGHRKAHLTRACVALERGDFERAREIIDDAKPSADEAEFRVLERVIEHRVAGVGWLESLRLAWNAEGRPDLEEAPGLFGTWRLPELPEEDAWLRKHPASDERARSIFAVLAPPSSWSRAHVMETLQRIEDAGIGAALLDVAARSEGKVDAGADVRVDQVRKAAARLESLHPESMQFPLAALLVGVHETTPLSTPEIAELERIGTLARARTDHFEALFHEAHRVFSRAGVRESDSLAFMAAVSSVAGESTWKLQKRAQASRSLDEVERARASAAVWQIGVAQTRMPTMVEKLLGAILMEAAATLADDARRKVDAEAALRSYRQTLAEANKLHISGWPLPSLSEEVRDGYVGGEYDFMVRMVRSHGAAEETGAPAP